MTADEVLNLNFAEKMRARAEGRVPVVTAPAEPNNPVSTEAVESRFKAKMAAHLTAAKAAGTPAKVEAAPVAVAGSPTVVEAPKSSEAAELAALEEATRPDDSRKPKTSR